MVGSPNVILSMLKNECFASTLALRTNPKRRTQTKITLNSIFFSNKIKEFFSSFIHKPWRLYVIFGSCLSLILIRMKLASNCQMALLTWISFELSFEHTVWRISLSKFIWNCRNRNGIKLESFDLCWFFFFIIRNSVNICLNSISIISLQ